MTEIRWGLTASYVLSVLINAALPLVVAIFLARRFRAAWRWWFLGMGVFLVFQVVTRIPVMVVIQSIPAVKQRLIDSPAFFWTFLAMAAFTAGLFEEGGRWLAFRFVVSPAHRRLSTGLMLGAGHGGLEVFGVGLLQVAALVGYLAVTLAPPESVAAAGSQLAQARAQFASLQGWEPLMGAWERICAMAIQIAMTILVLNAFRRGPIWWWLALAAHTFVDFTSVAALRVGAGYLGQSRAMIATEALVTVYALAASWFLWRQRETPEPPPDVVEDTAEPPSAGVVSQSDGSV